MSSDRLIQAEEASSRAGRRRAAFVAFFFLVTLVGTGAIDLLWPAPAVTPVGEELRAAEEARRNRRLVDGSAARWLEGRASERSRVRRTVAPWWTAALIRLGAGSSPEVVVGRENWLFVRSRLQPPGVDEVELLTPGVHALRAIERRLSAAGTDLVAVPVPRKAVVCGSLLPPGVDARPEFDRAAIDMLRAAGVEVVDLMRAWETLDPRVIYLAQDSHWALDGQLAAAKAILALRPDLVRGEFEFEFERGWRERPLVGNRALAGIPIDHPAERWLPLPQEAIVLVPDALRHRFESIADPADAVVVGSSFSAYLDFPLLVFGLAGTDVANRSLPGQPFGWTLARLAATAPDGVLPKVILYEFPMHHFWELSGKHPRAMAGVGLTLLHLPYVEQTPLTGLLPFACRMPEADPRGILAHGAHGAVVSTGSGIVSVDIAGRGLEGRRLRFHCDAYRFDFTWPKGRERLLLPIVEGAQGSGYFALSAVDGGPADVTATLVVDLDLANARVLAQLDGAARVFGGGGEALEPRSAAVIRFARAPGARAAAEVVVTFEGEAEPLTEAFEVFAGATIVIDLAGHAGRRLAALEVRAPWPVDAVAIAAR